MPRVSTLSIMGLYNYDPTIFDGFRVPESIESRKQDIIDEICLEGAELEILYSNPDVMKFAITKWTNLNFKIWEELQATREYVYNPIWNKDGTYRETETRDLAGSKTSETASSKSGAITDEETQVLDANKKVDTESEVDTLTGIESDQTVVRDVMGYNETQWANAERDTTHGESETSDNTAAREQTDEERDETIERTRGNEYAEQTSGAGLENTTDTGTVTIERIEQGNIGVTTTQAMIKEQREVVDFSVERYIIDSFIERFCLMVY